MGMNRLMTGTVAATECPESRYHWAVSKGVGRIVGNSQSLLLVVHGRRLVVGANAGHTDVEKLGVSLPNTQLTILKFESAVEQLASCPMLASCPNLTATDKSSCL